MAQVDFSAPTSFRPPAPKARMTVYFALLIIAFFAMIVACILMYAEISRYGGFGTVPGKVTSIGRSAPAIIADLDTAICAPVAA